MSKNMTFDDIKASVTIERVAQMLDLRAKITKPSYFRTPCPACKRGGDKILQITTAGHWTQTFRCFAAEVTGDGVGLAAHVLGITQGQAAERIKSHFGLDKSSTAPSPHRRGKRQRRSRGWNPSTTSNRFTKRCRSSASPA